MKDSEKITYFAETDARGKKTPFGIKAKDRTRHVYVIGKTGMGKSTLLENMAVQDIQNGEGFAFVDPHGKTADLFLDYIPKERMKDVVYFAPFDIDNPIAFNIMEDVGPEKRHLVAAGLMSAFKKIWVDAWSARMEYILGNVILALLEYPGATMLSINRMLTDKDYRKAVIANITDPSTKSFWVDEFSKYTDRYTADATPAIQNKVGQFTANPLIRNIVGQSKSSFDIRKLMDEKKIIIINLSKGQIGEGNANLLGSMIITKIYLSAMSRADVPETEMQKLPNFYLYVDEFQSFANESFADILSEARKYKLNLTMAHQYIEQMSDEVRSAVFGNVGTMITFRVGAFDADVLEKEFAPVFLAEDLVNLGFTQVYLKLMIDGIGSHPFSATTLPPIAPPEKSLRKEVIENSRKLFTHPRTQVEDEIREWYKPVESAKERPAPKTESRSFAKPNTKTPPREPAKGSSHSTATPRSKLMEARLPSRPSPSASSPSSPTPTSTSTPSQPSHISLDVLKRKIPKPDKFQQQKKDKGPTPEKMKTLKEALAEVMKTEVSKNSEAQSSKVQSKMPASVIPHRGELTSTNFRRDKSTSAELRRDKPKFAIPPKKAEAKADPSTNAQVPPANNEVPKPPNEEVPEDVLNKILE